MSAESDTLRVLVVSDYWNSTEFTGGVTTLNRALCRALAERSDVTVTCRVGEEGPIRDSLVDIRTVGALPGVEPKSQLLRPEGRPRAVDVVIGHGTHSGGAAHYLRAKYYPEALGVHLLHTTPDEYARHRGKPELADLRATQERALIAGSDLAVGIGPLLYQEAARLARSAPHTTGREPTVHELVPGVPSDGVLRHPRLPGQTKFDLLMFGRIEDEVKQVQTAAAAVRLVRVKGHDVHFTVRGVKPESVPTHEAELSLLAGTQVKVKPFTSDERELAIDLAEADLVLAPALQEDFGLVAWESLGRRIPTLLTATSGVVRLLNDSARVPSHLGPASTVPQPEDRGDRPMLWAMRVERFLSDPAPEERRAQELGELLASQYSWARAAEQLSEQIGAARAEQRQRSGAQGGRLLSRLRGERAGGPAIRSRHVRR